MAENQSISVNIVVDDITASAIKSASPEVEPEIEFEDPGIPDDVYVVEDEN